MGRRSLATAPIPPQSTTRVLVLNMHAGRDAAGIDNLSRVAELITSTRADIVLLQEVDRLTRRSGGVDQPAVLERLTGLHATFGKTLDYDGGEYGIALLARRQATDVRVLPLQVQPPQERAGGSREPRGALIALVAAESRSMRVLNTHLDAGREDTYRLQETDVLVRRIDELPDTSPVIAGGDFNATPESPVIARMAAAGLRDAWPMCGRGDGLTYPAGGPVKRIDYLLLSAATRCTSAEVLPFEGSDHRPLLVSVIVR